MAWHAALKQTKDVGMLLMVAKGIRVGICNSINRYAKANNKYIKDFDKNEELLYLKYCDVNILYGCMVEQYHKGYL